MKNPISDSGDSTTYSSFLRTGPLLALQDVGTTHDQLLFVVIHQSHELWFKLVLHELDEAVPMVDQDDFVAAGGPVQRMTRIFQALVHQWEVLDSMTPAGYLAFRDELGGGSGFQSSQFREIEFGCGLPDPSYLESSWLDADERARLQRRLQHPTLREAFLAAVDRQGLDVTGVVRGGVNPVASMFAERLVDFDEAVAHWRGRHVLAVERQIGAKPGTGSSSGVTYLRSTTTKRFFPELWDARSVL